MTVELVSDQKKFSWANFAGTMHFSFSFEIYIQRLLEHI